MRKGLISILFLLPLFLYGQGGGAAFPILGVTTSSGDGAESIFLMNNSADDEKENNTLTLNGSAAFSTTGEVEGTHSLSTDCSGCSADISSIDYGNEFTLFGTLAKWGLTGTVCLLSGMSSDDGFELYVDLDDMELDFKTGNGTTTQTASSSSFTWAGGVTPMTYAVVVNRASGTVQFYAEGSSIGSGSVRTDFENTTTLRIGITQDGGSASWGYHDAIHIYKRSCSSDNISDLDSNPGTEVFE